VAAQSAEEATLSGLPRLFETFDLLRGMAAQYTVANGDFCVDAKCVTLGQERRFHNQQKLREKPHDSLICNAEHKSLQEAFAASQESVLADPSPSTTVVVQVAATSEVKEPDLTFTGMESTSKNNFTDEEMEAVSWACNLRNIDIETTLAVCRSLPSAVVTEQVERYRQREVSDSPKKVEEIKPHQRAKYGRGYTRNLLKTRMIIGAKFKSFLESHNMEHGRIEKGLLSKFFSETSEFNGFSYEDRTGFHRQRKFVFRCLNLVTTGHTAIGTKATQNVARGDGQRRHARDHVRKNRHGAAADHRVKASIVRSELFEWFSVMRHSVKTRIPGKVLEVKAKQIVQDYVTACLLNGVKPDPPTISAKWLKRWQTE
jgi:hypothetical protein